MKKLNLKVIGFIILIFCFISVLIVVADKVVSGSAYSTYSTYSGNEYYYISFFIFICFVICALVIGILIRLWGKKGR